MNSKNADSKKPTKESKLLDVLMAAKALSNLGSDEERSENGDAEREEEKPRVEKCTEGAIAPKVKKENDSPAEGDDMPTAIKTFPEKLMDMLDNEDVQDAITWLPGGKSFSIINPNKFTDNVLPRFFKQAKFESFVRKLYRWGFRQVDKGEIGHITFYHKNFQKGNVTLAVAKLRSVTPSKLSNAANKAAKERFINGPTGQGPASNAMAMSMNPGLGDCLPASTQSLLAQLRKDRSFDMKSGLPIPPVGGLQDMMSAPAAAFHGYSGAQAGFAGSIGSSMATRLLLKQQEVAAKMAAANSYGAALGSPGDSAGSQPSTVQAIMAKQKMAQFQAATLQSQMRMQAAARWQSHQSQLRQALNGPSAQQQQLAELRMGMGSHGSANYAANLASLMKPLPGSTRMQLDAAKQAMFQSLHVAQPSYGQDIVKAAVDALKNAP